MATAQFQAKWQAVSSSSARLAVLKEALTGPKAALFDINARGDAGSNLELLAALAMTLGGERDEKALREIAPQLRAQLSRYQPDLAVDRIECGVQLVQALACCETDLSAQQLQQLAAVMTRDKDVNAKSASGWTPLTAVAEAAAQTVFWSRNGVTKPFLQQVAHHLLNLGADPFSANAAGDTLLSLWTQSSELLPPLLERAAECSQILVALDRRVINAAGQTLLVLLNAASGSFMAVDKAALVAGVRALSGLYDSRFRPQIAAAVGEVLPVKDVAAIVINMFEA